MKFLNPISKVFKPLVPQCLGRDKKFKQQQHMEEERIKEIVVDVHVDINLTPPPLTSQENNDATEKTRSKSKGFRKKVKRTLKKIGLGIVLTSASILMLASAALTAILFMYIFLIWSSLLFIMLIVCIIIATGIAFTDIYHKY